MKRSLFITALFEHIQNDNYILLKWLGSDLADAEIGSDLDILIEPEVESNVVAFIESFNGIKSVGKEQLFGVTHYYIYFINGDFLQIDVLTKLVRKSMEYLSVKELFANSIIINGIKTCTTQTVFEHVLLFNFLNKSGIPQKYIEYYTRLSDNTQIELLQFINNKYKTTFKNFQETRVFNKKQLTNIINVINQFPQNNLTNKLKNTVQYGASIFRKLRNTRGIVITFSGVDGAGKSTIISDILNLLGQKYRRKVVVLRHRPSILPIISAWRYGKKEAEQRSVNCLPRQGKNKNTLSSYFRFGYYYIDYLLGQIYIWAKYLLRGYIVLYDRYYFDFIIDGKRSNIDIPSGVSKHLYWFVKKPELNFFLYADAETILKRKKELSPSVIEYLTNRYQQLFNEFSTKHNGVYLDIENINRQKTLHTIINHYVKLA